MQLEGIAKRKRRSSGSSNGGVENSPVAETKRLKVDDSRADSAGSLAEERLPLAELPIQQLDAEDSDADWLDACTDELLLTEEKLPLDAEDTAKRRLSENSEDRGSKNIEPPGETDGGNSINAVLPLRSPTNDILEKFPKHLGNRLDLINFFKRRGTSGAETRSEDLFENNPGLQPRMRSVLLEWIVEVCDVYKMYRETYHLAVDYIDRYLCKSVDISKHQLQLIGVTALLLAAKYEEIYPPKISDFAYITDGACTEQDIIKMENLMVQVLEWRITVITSNSWLLGFLQLLYCQDKLETEDVMSPLYNTTVYETVAHLMDLCSFDSGFLRYPYKVIALSSVCTVIENPNPNILNASGYTLSDIEDCLHWMQPFWLVLRQKFSYGSIASKTIRTCPKRPKEFSHMRIKHNVDLGILEAVHDEIEARLRNSVLEELLLTPPQSSEKRRKSNGTAQTKESEEAVD